MKTVNYILVDEAGTQNAACVIRTCKLPDIGHCVIVEAGGISDGSEVSRPSGLVSGSRAQRASSRVEVSGPGSRFQVSGFRARFQVPGFKDLELETRNLEQRGALIRELCRLRRRYPEAKILGISELREYCVHPSERMNQIRRAMSDLQ